MSAQQTTEVVMIVITALTPLAAISVPHSVHQATPAMEELVPVS